MRLERQAALWRVCCLHFSETLRTGVTAEVVSSAEVRTKTRQPATERLVARKQAVR